MTKHGSFKKVVRRHAEETGQRYTEALTDLEGLEERMFHEPVAERLLAHLRDRYGIDAVAATKVSHAQRPTSSASTATTATRGSRARFLRLARGPASRATPRSCGSWSGRTTRRSASRSTTRCRTSTGASVLVTRFVDDRPLPGRSARSSP